MLTEITLLFDKLIKDSTGQYMDDTSELLIRAKIQSKSIFLDRNDNDVDFINTILFKIQKYHWDSGCKQVLYKDQRYNIVDITEYDTDLVITCEEAQNE